jgi:hypothetical protein
MGHKFWHMSAFGRYGLVENLRILTYDDFHTFIDDSYVKEW